MENVMLTRQTRFQWLTKMSNRPMERVRFNPESSMETIQSMDQAVLFLMAFWSSGAVRAFGELSKELSLPENEKIELYVADVDDSPSLYELPEFLGKIHGWGETAWIYQGKIVATSGLGLNIDSFKPNTSTLNAFCKYGVDSSPKQIAAEFNWLPPWQSIGDSAALLENELREELPAGHPLFGIPMCAIAQREDCEEVLFTSVDDNTLAVVHLTWSRQADSGEAFPVTKMYSNWQAWVDLCLLPDHRNRQT